MRVLIVGCGYVGFPLGVELVQQGHSVWGMRRTLWPEAERGPGIHPISADISQPETLPALDVAYDWVIFCASASGGGIEEYRQIYLQGLNNVLTWLAAAPPQRFIYTSSTSVYGQVDGSLVDETSPTHPQADTGQVLVEAEATLFEQAKAKAIPAIILRLAGIYGPGRGYWLKRYLDGNAVIEGDGQRVLNMIHRDDVVGAVLAALRRGRAGETYNVVDDEPVSQLVVFEWLSRRLGRALSPRAPGDVLLTRKRGITNKRVSNHRLRVQLRYDLKCPTFRQGFEEEISRLR
jgi:nucleoside-diphosphate-sugar epimerase